MTARALAILTHSLGAAAFFYPFFLGSTGARSETLAHASDAPILFAVLSALLIAFAVSEVRHGRMDAKQIALLGILSGLNAVLRLPGSFGGASLMFVLPIACGVTFGSRFGFMLGASSMAASAAITGGVGPWMPFQMWALGWVGAGAGVLQAVKGRWLVPALAAYGWISAMLFGALMNLWFWPFQGGGSEVSWAPGLGVASTFGRYWRFYLVTSLAWDSTRAIANVVLIATLGGPIIRLLRRYRVRLFVTWRNEPEARAVA